MVYDDDSDYYETEVEAHHYDDGRPVGDPASTSKSIWTQRRTPRIAHGFPGLVIPMPDEVADEMAVMTDDMWDQMMDDSPYDW